MPPTNNQIRMKTKCEPCESSKQRPHSGVYNLNCPQCCARLVLSVYPSKGHAARMLAAINRYAQNPGRERVLECVRQELTKRNLAGQKSTTP